MCRIRLKGNPRRAQVQINSLGRPQSFQTGAGLIDLITIWRMALFSLESKSLEQLYRETLPMILMHPNRSNSFKSQWLVLIHPKGPVVKFSEVTLPMRWSLAGPNRASLTATVCRNRRITKNGLCRKFLLNELLGDFYQFNFKNSYFLFKTEFEWFSDRQIISFAWIFPISSKMVLNERMAAVPCGQKLSRW